jgi:outer membrane protein assembly factor BamB
LLRSRAVLIPFLFAALMAAGLSSCGKNRPPDVPERPIGPSTCFKDTSYTFGVTLTDADGDSVAACFFGFDAADSAWTEPVASGEMATMTRAWPDTGTYQVRARARDKSGLCSDWSEPLTVRVVDRRPPDLPAAPVGPDSGMQDTSYSFAAAAFHPSGITVSVRFSWGDTAVSEWSPFVASGETVRMSHAWSVLDTYAVTVQAKDTGDLFTEWSAPHLVVIQPVETVDTMRKWRYQLKTGEDISLNSSPAIGADGTIYVGSPDSCLYALNPDGSLKWRFETGWYIRSSPAVGADGTIYFGSYDDCLYALNPDGSLKWRFETGWSVLSSPAIGADGTVFFGSGDHHIYALNPDSTLKWRYGTPSSVYSSPAIGADGTVYIGSLDEYLYALNPDSTLKWRYLTGGNIEASPAIGPDGTIYFGSDDKYIYALNPDSTLKWSHKTGDLVQSSAAIGPDGTVYFGSFDNILYAFSPAGEIRWMYETGNDICTAPAIAADGTIFIGSCDYNLYALNPDGSLKWKYATGGRIEASPTIAPDGTVYITSGDGCLYALKGKSPLAETAWPKFRHDLKNTGRIGGR